MTEKKATKTSAGRKTVRVTQTGSVIGRQQYQRDTLLGLGLTRIGKSRDLPDTPDVRGMIESVKHLLKVEEGSK